MGVLTSTFGLPFQRLSDLLPFLLIPWLGLRRAVVAEAVRHGLPQMDRRWQGRFLPDAVLAGPEARGSSPVRIDRDPASRESPGVPGLYPVGEGAGFAGGIVSAAVDGLRTARALIARYTIPTA